MHCYLHLSLSRMFYRGHSFLCVLILPRTGNRNRCYPVIFRNVKPIPVYSIAKKSKNVNILCAAAISPLAGGGKRLAIRVRNKNICLPKNF